MLIPAFPREWKGFKIERKFRGDTYEIDVDNSRGVSHGVREVIVDGKKVDRGTETPPCSIIPIFGDGKTHKVVVKLG